MFLQCWDDLQYFVVQRQDDLLLFGSVSFFYWIAFTGTKEFHDSRILIRAALFLCQRCSQFQICFFCFTDWICWSGSCKLQIGSEKLDLATNRGDAAFMFHLHIYRIEKQIPYEALNKKKVFRKLLIVFVQLGSRCIFQNWIEFSISIPVVALRETNSISGLN